MRRTAATTPQASTATRADHSGRPVRSSLQRRILTRMLLVSMVPLLLIGSLTLGSLWALSRSPGTTTGTAADQTTQDAAGRAVRADATGVAREVEELLAERVTDVVDWAAVPAVRGAARAAAQSGGGDALAATPSDEIEAQFADQRRLRPGSGVERYLRSATDRLPGFSQLMLTDRNGLVVGAAKRPGSIVQRTRTAWTRAWEDGVFIGDMSRLGGRDVYGMVIAARVEGPQSGERFGVLLATLDLEALQAEVDGIAADGDAAVALLRGDGALLAETSSGHRGSRMMDPEVQITGDRAEVVDAAVAADAPGFQRVGGTLAGFAPLAAVDAGLDALLGGYDGVDADGLHWTALVEQPVDAAPGAAAGPATAQRDLDRALRRFAVIVAVTLALALAAAAIVSARLARGIVAPLRRLSSTARDVADSRLPALVATVQERGADADAPPLPSLELQTDAEIAEVAEAFNSVGHTAAHLATDQARSRRNVARMFVNLGRRNQSLLSRQLEYIDRLEREESDADVLEHLFQLDHLATRMRRNAESLLVLAGEEPPRRWSAPVPLSDVVRGAVGEIEDYQRVSLDGLEEVGLLGRAVGDVSHLIAELVENATNFSPPDSTVRVTGRRVDEGYSLAVTDHGVGMTAEQFADANQRIDTSPRVDRVPASYLGLFVVGRLAARHGIRVRLVASTTEGVTAKVLLPSAIVEAAEAEPARSEDAVPAVAATSADAARSEDAVPAAVATPAGHTDARSGDAAAAGDRDQRSVAWVDTPERSDTALERRGAEPATVAGAVARAGRQAGEPSTDDPEWPRLPHARIRQDHPDRGDPGRGDGDTGGHGGPPREIDVRGEVGALERTDELTPVMPDAPIDGSPGDEPRDGVVDDGPVVDEPVADGPAPPLAVPRRTSKRDPGSNAHGLRNGHDRDEAGRVVLRPEGPQPGSAPAVDAGRPVSPGAPAATDEDGVTLTDAERRARLARQRLATFQRAVRHGRAQTARQHDTGAGDG